MLNETSGSSASSDATSAASHAKTGRAKRGDEAEFLAAQAVEARAAIDRTTRELKDHLQRTWSDATDVRLLIARHPWLALGSAAAAGLVAGVVLTPKPNETVQEKWSRTAESVLGHGSKHERGENENGRSPQPAAPAGPSPWLMVLSPLIDLARTAAEGYIATLLANNAQQSKPSAEREYTTGAGTAPANGEVGMGNGES